MKLKQAFIHLHITSADPIAALQRLMEKNIDIFRFQQTDDFTAELDVHRKDYLHAMNILSHSGDKVLVTKTGTVIRHFIIARHVAVVGFLLLVLLSIFLSTRVLFIEVAGNEHLPQRLIIEKAAECGIRFGTSRRVLRSEKMKNALLSTIPELHWAGINTNGCVATIHVVEKKELSPSQHQTGPVTSIVASWDGVITSCTVYKGSPLCKPGQVVKAGQILVSGYSDCGISIKATQADAEIMGQTTRSIHAVTPTNYTKREAAFHKEVKYSLLIGKKLINFFQDSGICDATCVKMYKEDYITLPGGFRLPVALVTQTVYYYESTGVTLSEFAQVPFMDEYCDDYLLQQMTAGRILASGPEWRRDQELIYFDCTYSCLEMIGQVKNEEIIFQYGKHF